MPQHRDFYELLGIPRTASADEVRKAYLKLAHKYHPDKTGGDKQAEEKLKEINEAYDTLKNAEKRAKYDQFGHMADQFGGQGFTGGFGFGGAGAGFESPIEDFIREATDAFLFRSGGRTRAGWPGNDLEYRLAVNLREAAFGVKKTIRFARRELCNECRGSGAAAGTQPQACPDCGGSGQVRRAQGLLRIISQTCPRCRGAGRVIAKPCGHCGGTGRTKANREISVDLPPGVDTGSRLRLSGEGEPGDSGGPRGDLYILIEVQPDEIFQRDSNDVLCEVPVSLTQAALGDTIRVPTLRSEAELKIPAGTQSGKVFRMRGMGIPDVHGFHKGDELVRIHVETPTHLTREQKELLRQFHALGDGKNYPLHYSFMDKLKQWIAG